MKNTLWTVVSVVALFLGFSLGYSTAPMMQVGLDVVRGEQTEIKPEIDEATEQYYKDLLKGD